MLCALGYDVNKKKFSAEVSGHVKLFNVWIFKINYFGQNIF